MFTENKYGLTDTDYLELMREVTNFPCLTRDICDEWPNIPRVPMDYMWQWLEENDFVYKEDGCYFPTEQGDRFGLFTVEITGYHRYDDYINDHIPMQYFDAYPVVVIEYGAQFQFIDMYLNEIVPDYLMYKEECRKQKSAKRADLRQEREEEGEPPENA